MTAPAKQTKFLIYLLFVIALPGGWMLAQQAPPGASQFIQFRQSGQPGPLKEIPEILPELEQRRKREEPTDEPEEAIRFYLSKRLPEGETDLPVERYLAAKEQMELMPQYSTAFGIALPSRAAMRAEPEQSKLGVWTSLGPGNIGGRTRAILIHPQDANVMYAAGVAGGVWKTTDAGKSWAPLTEMLPNIAVVSLAFEPANPNTIYAGTGEGVFNADGVRGLGIFKTTDAGATWRQLANTSGADFQYVNKIIVSRNDNRKVYAATRTGVWRSDDAGENWGRVLPTNVQGGCLDLAMRTDQTTDYVFAACGTFAQARIYRNRDAGATGLWDEVFTEAGMGRTSLAIAPSNQNVIYAISASIAAGNYNNGLHAVFRSAASGDAGSWAARARNTNAQKINTAIFSNPLLLFQTNCKLDLGDSFLNQGWYDNVIAVDPLDANRVWAGGIDLFRSDDGGANWGVASYWWTGPPNVTFPVAQYAHADNHFIAFHPKYDGAANQIMFVGGDGGVFRTDNARSPVALGNTGPCDPANSQVKWISLNNGYGVTQFYHGSVYPDGKSYFGGTQDNGTVRGTDAAGVNGWEPINGGDGGYTAIDPTNPNVLFSEFTGFSLRKSTDNGAHFSVATYGLSDSGMFITPYVMDPSDPQRLYIGGQMLWRTTNGAARWASVAQPSPSGSQISAIAVAPTDANFVMAGLSSGAIFRTNRGVALTSSQAAASPSEIIATPRTGTVSWLVFDPAKRDVAYATYSNFGGAHVWRTVDGGQTWISIDGAGAAKIPDIPVHCIVVDPTNTARLYVGTDMGVLVSADGGGSWSVENNGFPNTVTESLAINVVDGVTTLYAFTHGRGAFKVVLDQSGCSYMLSPATLTVPPDGSDAVVNVTVAPSGCGWNATSQVPWITVAPNSNGTGSGTVGMKVEANRTFARRSGSVAIDGHSFTIVQDGQTDLEAPAIAIANPPNPFTTPNSLINLSGTSSDNLRVASVIWRSDSGLSGTAAGTGSWTISGLPLVAGRNEVMVTAIDEAGNRASAAAVIFSMPSGAANVLTTVAGSGVRGFSGDGGLAAAASVASPLRMTFDGAGNFYFCDFANNRIRRVTPGGTITTFAGNGEAGFGGDGGTATAAQLNQPVSVAIDKDGNVYIADRGNQRIRKVAAATDVMTTFAGTGTAGFSGDNGQATAARLNSPNAVAVDAAGNLYIADTNNNRIRRVVTGGVISTFAGTGQAGFSGDGGDAASAQLRTPFELAVDGAGDLYIVDNGNNRIRKITIGNSVINTIAGTGTAGIGGDGGPAVNANIGNPQAIAVDNAKNLYIADSGNSRIRRVDAGTGVINLLAGGGGTGFSPDGALAIGSRQGNPQGVAVDVMGAVYFADLVNNRIRKIVAMESGDKESPVVTIIPPTGGGGAGNVAFNATSGAINLGGTATDNNAVVAVRWNNNRGGDGFAFGTAAWTIPLVALRGGNNIITVTAWDANGNAGSAQALVNFTPQRLLVTVAGTGAIGASGDGGPGSAATLFAPTGVTVDGDGNVYFTDSLNHRVRRVALTGEITAFAGTGQLGNSGDGGPAVNASLNNPTGIVADDAGNIYIADSGNNRVRKVSTDGRIITIAGSGRDDFGGDGGPATAAHFSNPSGLTLDKSGNLFIVDRFNLRVRKVNLGSGIVTTVAGNGQAGFSGDGGAATDASLYVPAGVAADAAGNLYICDQGNARIRRVTTDGRINTVAGNGVNGYGGDGIAAISTSLNNPFFVAVDAAGDLYIADQSNHRIRKVTISTGMISTVAGTGVSGSAGEPATAEAVQLSSPTGIAVNVNGDLFIADRANNRICRTRSAAEINSAGVVSAASFAPSGDLTSESIVSAFISNLPTSVQSAATLPLPLTLAGATVRVRDSLGIDRIAPLFFVSATQINHLIPNGTANGTATVTVTRNNGLLTNGAAIVSTGSINIATVAPGLFAANANGQGVVAAVAFRRKVNGQESYEPVARFDAVANRFVSVPIDLGPDVGPASDQVFLIAYGTGFRNRSALSNVRAMIGGVNAPVFFAGATPGFAGLDQANLQLDRSLAGKGEVDLVFTVDGKTANPVKVNVK